WIYNTQQALLTSLFDKILESAGIKYSNSSLKAISNSLVKSIMGSNIVVNIAGNILFQNNAENEVRKLKERIRTHLEQNDKTMVVFIDNMDRASAGNIIFLLKIISNIFDLNRIVYVLSYDKERVNEILNRNLNINKRYIEKIIQQEIKVTELNRDKFHNIVSDCLYRLFGIYGVPNVKYKDFNYIIDFLAKYTDDIREFKRIMNSVCAVVSVKNELYKPDLFTLELIRFVDNDLYEDIHRHSKYYVSADLNKNVELYASIFNRKKFNDEGKEYFSKLQDKYGINILKLLSNIFPYVVRFLKGKELLPEYDDNEINKQIELNCGAASAKYFDLYFHFGENEYIMVSKVYNEFMKSIMKEKSNDSIENIPKLFDVLFDSIPIYYHIEIISKLWFARNDFEKDLNLPIIIGLVRNSQKLDKEQGFFSLSAYQRACAIMATLFSHLSEEEKTDLINYLKDDYKFINVYDEILYWLNSSSLNYDKKEQDAKLFEDMIINMFNEIIKIPIDIYSDENYGYRNSWAVLRTKRKVLNLDKDSDIEMIDYISAIMQPNYIYKILRDVIGFSTGSGGYDYYISQNSLKSFFDDENIIFEYLQQCPPSNQTEEFIYSVYEKYKSDEVDDWGNKSINVNHYIRLW
ncbi:MAG: KAP family NTPase, partial [Lachnospiraceae bacterium]|nr:KAP family NTPase [Lachnospiraceae bacterium]